MTDSHDVSTLQSLLATVVDSNDGFAQASGSVEGAEATRVFDAVAGDRRAIAAELEAEIRRRGGEPAEKGTILGGAHHLLMKLRDAVSSGDAGVVDEAERGEDYIKGKFESAAQDDDLGADTRAVVSTLAGRVRAGHDQVRALKQAVHAAG